MSRTKLIKKQDLTRQSNFTNENRIVMNEV